jgi:hypothetical protein
MATMVAIQHPAGGRNLIAKIPRNILGREVNPTKTEASETAVPLDPG